MTQTVKELQEICAAWMMGATVWFKREGGDWDTIDPFADEKAKNQHLNWRLYKVAFLGAEPHQQVIYRVGDEDAPSD